MSNRRLLIVEILLQPDVVFDSKSFVYILPIGFQTPYFVIVASFLKKPFSISDLKIKSDLEKRCKAEDGFLAPHEKSKLEKLQKKYKNHSGWQIYRGRKEIMM